MAKRTIKITDHGPIKEMESEVPEEGVLRYLGINGAGKSKALEAVDFIATGHGGLETRDGAPRAEVSAFDVTVRLGRRLSRIGTLGVKSLEGKFSLADLVDPEIKDPLAADNKRIKALVQLTDIAKADPSLFYGLVGGQENFNRYVTAESLATDDLVIMAARVKADLEKAARKANEEFSKIFAAAEAARAASADVDTTVEHDGEALSAALEEAVRAESSLQEQARSATRIAANTDKAKAALQRAKDTYKGPSVEEAELVHSRSAVLALSCKEKVMELKRQLEAAEKELNSALTEEKRTFSVYEEAQRHFKAVEEFEIIANADQPEPISLVDLEVAANTVKTAREAVELGALARRALSEQKRAESLREQALTHEKLSFMLRDAALATDSVLSGVVQTLGCPLTVHGGRLMAHVGETEELFSRLSDGQRVDIAMDIAIKAVGRGGIIVVPQRFWQDLDPINKRAVAIKLIGTGVLVVTAEASADPELRTEVYEPFELVKG